MYLKPQPQKLMLYVPEGVYCAGKSKKNQTEITSDWFFSHN